MPSQTLKEMDPDQVDVIVGLVPMSGFADGTMVTIEADGPLFTIKKGADGQITRSKSLTVTLSVTIRLMNSSRSNAVLSGFMQADRRLAGGAGVVPVAIVDRNGTSITVSDTAWIEELPKPERGEEASANEWKLRLINWDFFEGGT